MGRWLVMVLVAGLLGCGAELPDRDDPGALVLQARCGTCHAVHAPGTMTFEMWKVQLTRMRQLFAQRRMPWLTEPEERALLRYLETHAGGQTRENP
jgi:Dihaem cytochrome c